MLAYVLRCRYTRRIPSSIRRFELLPRDAMHSPDLPPVQLPTIGQPWWRDLTRYHWFVLVVAALAWMADCMDQQLFNIARQPAMQELLRPSADVPADDGVVKER